VEEAARASDVDGVVDERNTLDFIVARE